MALLGGGAGVVRACGGGAGVVVVRACVVQACQAAAASGPWPRLLLPVPATATFTQQQRHYAKPLAGLGKKGRMKMGPTVEKVRLPVETDPEKLANYVCGSHPVKENREDVKLGEDHEYPDWLWTLRTGKPPPLEEMDPDTKQYWRRLRTMAMWEKNKLRKTKKY